MIDWLLMRLMRCAGEPMVLSKLMNGCNKEAMGLVSNSGNSYIWKRCVNIHLYCYLWYLEPSNKRINEMKYSICLMQNMIRLWYRYCTIPNQYFLINWEGAHLINAPEDKTESYKNRATPNVGIFGKNALQL